MTGTAKAYVYPQTEGERPLTWFEFVDYFLSIILSVISPHIDLDINK